MNETIELPIEAAEALLSRGSTVICGKNMRYIIRLKNADTYALVTMLHTIITKRFCLGILEKSWEQAEALIRLWERENPERLRELCNFSKQ